jgi:hypothetical protein
MQAMTPSLPSTDVATDRAPKSLPRSRSSIEDELAVVADELAAARELFATCDPDCPPWSIEAEIRRLELRWHVLAANASPPPSPGGDASTRLAKSFRSAA